MLISVHQYMWHLNISLTYFQVNNTFMWNFTICKQRYHCYLSRLYFTCFDTKLMLLFISYLICGGPRSTKGAKSFWETVSSTVSNKRQVDRIKNSRHNILSKIRKDGRPASGNCSSFSPIRSNRNNFCYRTIAANCIDVG